MDKKSRSFFLILFAVIFTHSLLADLLDIDEDVSEPKKIQKVVPRPPVKTTSRPTKKTTYRDPASFSGSDSKNCRVYFRGDELEASKLTRDVLLKKNVDCLLYTSPSPRDRTRSRMPSSA